MNILRRVGETRPSIWNQARLLFENRAVAFSTGVAEPVKVCIVGSGPAGFYSADKVCTIILQRVDHSAGVNAVDVHCRLQRGCQMDAILIFWYECLFGILSCASMLRQESCAFYGIYIQESLPCPYGLVRSGVAPDHPDTKVCGWIQGSI